MHTNSPLSRTAVLLCDGIGSPMASTTGVRVSPRSVASRPMSRYSASEGNGTDAMATTGVPTSQMRAAKAPVTRAVRTMRVYRPQISGHAADPVQGLRKRTVGAKFIGLTRSPVHARTLRRPGGSFPSGYSEYGSALRDVARSRNPSHPDSERGCQRPS